MSERPPTKEDALEAALVPLEDCFRHHGIDQNDDGRQLILEVTNSPSPQQGYTIHYAQLYVGDLRALVNAARAVLEQMKG